MSDDQMSLQITQTLVDNETLTHLSLPCYLFQIASGLRQFVPLEEFKGSMCLAICNLKPVKMRGETSNGMVLAASNADKTKVELVQPPPSAKPGDRVSLEGIDISTFSPDATIDGKKDNTAWSRLRDGLRTDDSLVATHNGTPLVVGSHGQLKAKSIANATLS